MFEPADVDLSAERGPTVTRTMKATIQDGVILSPYPPCYIPRCSIYRAIKEAAELSPDHPALEDRAMALTRSQFFVMIQRYATGFQFHGIQPGDHICAHLSNSVENFVTLIGCLFAGATVVLAKTSLTPRELLNQMRDSDATYLLTEETLAEKSLAVAMELNFKGFFVVGAAPGFLSVNEFCHMDEKAFREVPVHDPENTLVAIVYTSGTTGIPKGVEFTHWNLVSSIYIIRECLARERDDIRLCSSPIAHASGLVLTLSAALYAENCILTSPALTLPELIDAVEQFQITTLSFFPTQLQNIVHKMNATETKIPNVRRVTVGGGVLTESLARDALSAFNNLKEFINVYAMSECCGILAIPPRWSIHYHDMGFPASSVQIKVIDANSQKAIGPMQLGEICFRTPAAARGYYKREAATKEFKDPDGWSHTGDIGYYDDEGKVHYVDRMKDMIKCMDNQVAPGELEELLRKEHEGIYEVAVVGVPHPHYGEAPAAIIVLKDEYKGSGTVTDEHIKEIISKTCAVHKHLHGGVYFVDELPKTNNGKIHKKNILQNLLRRVYT